MEAEAGMAESVGSGMELGMGGTEVGGGRWELGEELSGDQALRLRYRTFLARETGGGRWRKVLKLALDKGPQSPLANEIRVLKTAQLRRNKNRGCVPELWDSGEVDGRQWLVREGLGQPLSAASGREPAVVLKELRHALAALEELHQLGFLAAGSLGPASFSWRVDQSRARLDGEVEEARLVLSELSMARPLALGPSGQPSSPLAGLLGPGLDYGRRDDLMGMLAWAAGAAGPGLPWEGLQPEEAAWLKWVLPPSVLLHRLHPTVTEIWRGLRRLQPEQPPDYAGVQSLLKRAADQTPLSARRPSSPV